MSAQTTFINNLLNAAFHGATYTGGTIQMGLFRTSLPSGGGAEVSGGSYARQTLTFNAAASKSIAISANASYTNLPSGQTIVAYGIYDGTTLIDEGMLASPFTADTTNNQLQMSYTFNLNA